MSFRLVTLPLLWSGDTVLFSWYPLCLWASYVLDIGPMTADVRGKQVHESSLHSSAWLCSYSWSPEVTRNTLDQASWEVERLESQGMWETPSWTIQSSYNKNPQDDESHFCSPCQDQQSCPAEVNPNCHLTRNIHFFQLIKWMCKKESRISSAFPFKLKYYNEVIFLLNL